MSRSKEKILRDIAKIDEAIREDIENLKKYIHEKEELEAELREAD